MDVSYKGSINDPKSAANYIREILSKSSNALYKSVAKIADDNELLDAFPSIITNDDRQRMQIEEQIRYIKNGKGDSKFASLIKEAAKQGEISHAKDAIYSAAAKGIKNTEKELEFSAAIGQIENAKAGYSFKINPYARMGQKLEGSVNYLTHQMNEIYQRTPLEHRT